MGALPLGLETYCEVISVDLLQPLDISKENLPKIMAELSRPFPRGMEIVNIEPLHEKLSKHMPTAMIYSFTPDAIPEGIMEKFESKTLPVVLNHRGQEINLNEHLLGIQIAGDAIITKVKCNNMGTTVSPLNIYAALM